MCLYAWRDTCSSRHICAGVCLWRIQVNAGVLPQSVVEKGSVSQWPWSFLFHFACFSASSKNSMYLLSTVGLQGGHAANRLLDGFWESKLLFPCLNSKAVTLWDISPTTRPWALAQEQWPQEKLLFLTPCCGASRRQNCGKTNPARPRMDPWKEQKPHANTALQKDRASLLGVGRMLSAL